MALAYARLIGLILAALVIAFGVVTVQKWHRDSQQLESVRQEMADLKASQIAAQKASEGFQNELADIRNRPVPRTPVRLCVKPPVSSVAGGSQPGLPAAGMVPESDGTDPEVRAGGDIGPALRSLARRADEVSAQGRATQSLHSP